MKLLQKERTVLSRDIRNYIYVRDKGSCEYCSAKVQPDFFHVDHIVPFAKGGTDAIENLVLSCVKCNQSKKARLLPLEIQQSIIEAVIKRNREMDNKPTPLIFIETRKRPAKTKTCSFGSY
ncbi:MAG: HNH endonuclease, partial [Candidatus Kapaibacteriota bacterium]